MGRVLRWLAYSLLTASMSAVITFLAVEILLGWRRN
jgi:hypothetical protein